MKNELWARRASNYAPATMPVLVVEPTHLTTVSGMADDVQNKVMAPLPLEIYRSYGKEGLQKVTLIRGRYIEVLP
jgi:hypothetical protein